MFVEDNIQEDEIRIVGSSKTYSNKGKSRRRRNIVIAAVVFVILCIVIVCSVVKYQSYRYDQSNYNTGVEFNETTIVDAQDSVAIEKGAIELQSETMQSADVEQIDASSTEIVKEQDCLSYMDIEDLTINDIPLKKYTPHNADAYLQVERYERLNPNDKSIVFSAQAADIRADNKKILGAFVLKGRPLAWGLSKKGFCAIIDGKMTIGVADNSPLFEEATEKGGYFFRQFGLVDNGTLVDVDIKGKAIRRALCDIDGQTVVISSETKESFHDFAQALVDVGVSNAIYLVGSATYGWAVDKSGEKHEFGLRNYRPYPNISYIVWRKQAEK